MRRAADPFWLPAVVFLAVCALETTMILRLNESHFAYTLDDPYIHLALAENLARGHYGVNAAEPSAPSSSALWPFVLAPFARSAIGHLVPLAFNLLASLAIVFVYAKMVALVLPSMSTRSGQALPALLVVLLVIGTNVVGLAFTGMEHSLQVLLVAAIVLGLVSLGRSGRLPWWLPLAIVVAPLVRYENLAFSLPALGLLAFRGRARAATVAALALVVTLGGFTLFLRSLELGALPSSVVAKSHPVASGGALRALAGNVSVGLTGRQGAVLGIAGLLLLTAFVRRREPSERGLAAALFASVALHFVMGRFGWYNRYEVYVWTGALLGLAYLHRDWLQRLLVRDGPVRAALLPAAAIGVAAFPYVHGLYTLPVAANNIYEQHFQMHRFAADYFRGPVAVNDLGRVAYGNEHYVLDLWGLASREALDLRHAETTSDWIEQLTAAKGVSLAMVYAPWFPELPAGWREVGTLHLSRKLVSAARRTVTFFALDDDTHERATALAREFRTTLPVGVRFVVAGEEAAE